VQQPAGTDYPADLLLPFDAYVIGVEKDNANRIGAPTECAALGAQADCLQIGAAYFAQKTELRDKVRLIFADQHRPTFVSHIARFDVGSPPCFVSNDYAATRMCAGAHAGVGAASVDKSWSALTALGQDLDNRLGILGPTHIIIHTMGWNTPQREALGNFRDHVAKLNEAATSMTAQGSFRPLVIGVTWPSTGSPTISKTDFLIKAKDADEVGAIWIDGGAEQVIEWGQFHAGLCSAGAIERSEILAMGVVVADQGVEHDGIEQAQHLRRIGPGDLAQ
jgi:hypothetical protein